MKSQEPSMAVQRSAKTDYKSTSRVYVGDSLNDGSSHDVRKASFCCQNRSSVTTTWAPFHQLLFGLFWELCAPLSVTCAAG